MTRTEVATTLARPSVDANGNVKWFEAKLMRIQVASLQMRIQTGLSVKSLDPSVFNMPTVAWHF